MDRREAPLYSEASAARAHLAEALPPVIGHRGAAASAPENTLAGLRKASELGCRWVEFDVRLTADRHLILLHDDRIERTTDGRGNAAALPLVALRRHDAGTWWSRGFSSERIPTLAEAVMLLGQLGVRVAVANVAGAVAQDDHDLVNATITQVVDATLDHGLVSEGK